MMKMIIYFWLLIIIGFAACQPIESMYRSECALHFTGRFAGHEICFPQTFEEANEKWKLYDTLLVLEQNKFKWIDAFTPDSLQIMAAIMDSTSEGIIAPYEQAPSHPAKRGKALLDFYNSRPVYGIYMYSRASTAETIAQLEQMTGRKMELVAQDKVGDNRLATFNTYRILVNDCVSVYLRYLERPDGTRDRLEIYFLNGLDYGGAERVMGWKNLYNS